MTTANKGMQFPANGGAVNQWDTINPGGVNTNFTIVDTALGGTTAFNVTGLAGNQTLSLAQYTPPNIKVSGTLTANVNLLLPAGVGGIWSIANTATGAFSVSFGVTGTTLALVPYGGRVLVVSDGTNISYALTSITSPGTTGMIPYTNSSGFLTASANIASDGTNLTIAGNIACGQSVNTAQLSASGAVSGAGIVALFSSPSPIGTVAQNVGYFTRAATPTVALGNSGSAFTVNTLLSNVFTVTMTANAALTVGSAYSGQTINVQITQDGTGGRVITWPANFKWPSGAALSLSTAAVSIDLLVATYNGTNWLATLAKGFA